KHPTQSCPFLPPPEKADEGFMKTIVSISPVKVEADSRTFKQAASITGFGYNSIVVEGERSSLDRNNLPFELLSLENGSLGERKTERALPDIHKSGALDGKGIKAKLQRLAGRVGLLYLIQLRHPIRGFLTTLVWYLHRCCLLPLKCTPRASLYLLHSPLQFPAIYLLSKRYRVPFIYDAHDFY